MRHCRRYKYWEEIQLARTSFHTRLERPNFDSNLRWELVRANCIESMLPGRQQRQTCSLRVLAHGEATPRSAPPPPPQSKQPSMQPLFKLPAPQGTHIPRKPLIHLLRSTDHQTRKQTLPTCAVIFLTIFLKNFQFLRIFRQFSAPYVVCLLVNLKPSKKILKGNKGGKEKY